MKIKKMTIENFRGIKFLEINMNNQNILIQGENGKGKTTIVNAFTWLLFGKIFDHSNEISKFEIQNVNHKEDDSIVEVEFDSGLVLKKVNKIKATKKRGTLEFINDGSKNEYYINEVLKKMKDYDEYINSIVDEKTFKILSNPMYFNTLDWKEKRDLIMSLTTVNFNLAEEYEKIASLKATCTKINKKLDETSIRIKENNLKIDENLHFNPAKVKEIETLIEELELKKNNIAKLNAEKTSKIYDEINKLNTAKMDLNNKISEIGLKNAEKSGLETQLKLIDSRIQDIGISYSELTNEIKEMEEEIANKRKEFAEENERNFEMSEEDKTCKACGSELPQDLKGKKFDKMLSDFTKLKANRLEKIRNEGKSLVSKKENKEKRIETLGMETETALKTKEDVKIKLDAFKETEVGSLENDIRLVDGKINDLMQKTKEVSVSDESEINQQIQSLKASLQAEKQIEFKINEQFNLRKRIKELEEEKKEQAKIFFDKQKELNILESEIKNKVTETVKNIEGLFTSDISFKLFQEQKNGGIQETFDVEYQGRAYNLPISNGEKIFVGLELIKVLQRKYNLELPIFIDNFEGLTKEVNMSNQLIMLECRKNCELTIV